MDHLIKHLILYAWKKNKTTSSISNQKKKKEEKKLKMWRASMCYREIYLMRVPISHHKQI